MSEPIDFVERKNMRDVDPEHVRKDDCGRQMYEYLLSYEFNGSSWGGVTVWAYSMDDAQQRVNAMRQSVVLMGQLGGVVPA